MLLVTLLAACRRGGAAPTARPTVTSTPRSTPLPPLPTPLPIGSSGNPLRLSIVAPEAGGAARDAADALEAALLEDTDLVVEVRLVESDAEALAALCDSVTGDISAAWLGGLGYAAAYAQNCGSAALLVERGERANAQTGEEVRVVANRLADIDSIEGLVDQTFCRLGVSDVYSWLVPLIMLESGGLASAADLADVIDYDDPQDMIAAVSAGDCDAAGIAASDFDALPSRTRSTVRTLAESVAIPYAVLVYPPSLPLGEQQRVTDALVSIGNGTRADMLNALVGQDSLLATDDGDLGSLRSFVSRSGIDLAQAGN